MRQHEYIWLRHLAVIVLYALSYSALRSVSFSHWFLPAGLRLLCLFFVPRRYWAGLVVGEMLPLAKMSYECFETFGLTYALLKLIPPILFIVPIVHLCCKRLEMFGPKNKVRMSALLLCTLLVSIVTSARDMLFLLAAPASSGTPTGAWAGHYFIGNYLGILTVVPLALAIRANYRREAISGLWTRLSSSRLVLDSVAALLPTLAVLCWIATHSGGEIGQAARIAMFLPVTALAMRHGWQGAALGGSAASIAIAISMPAMGDPVTLQAEVYMSFAISTLLVLGGRIAVLNSRDEDDRQMGRLALQAAQQGIFASEIRMQRAADTIEKIAESVHSVQGQLFERLRFLMSPTEELHYSRQFVASRHEVFKLANNLSPRVLQSRGLPHALQDASIAYAFEKVGVEYQCELMGAGLDDLQPSVQFALYRLVAEASAYTFEQATLSEVRVRVRAGMTKGRRWVVARLDSVHGIDSQDLMPSLMACEEFRQQVGATCTGITALRDQAFVYGGTVHLRSRDHGTRLALLLHDAAVPAAPIRVT